MNPFVSLAIALLVVGVVGYVLLELVLGDVLDNRIRRAVWGVALLGLFFYGLSLFHLLPAGCARAV
jgi:hypothetical protein